MGYLGLTPITAQQSYLNIDDISGSFNGVTTSFALLVGGVAPVPFPVTNTCLISVNGVIQEPDDSGSAGFRISGGNIVFSSAPTSGHAFFGVILAGADYVNVGVNFPDGTLGAPSITFSSDTDTGLYRSASGQLSIASNGVAAGTFSSSAFLAVAGSAGTPSISQLSDTNTGIYFPDADKVAISTRGSERLFVDSSGRVGVGTANPTAALNVSTGGTDLVADFVGTSSPYIRIDNGTKKYIAQVTGSDFRIQNQTDSTECLRIDSSGRLGLGTSSASAKIHVQDAHTLAADTQIALIENTTTGEPASLAFLAKADSGSNGNKGAIYFDAGAGGGTADNKLQFTAAHQDSITPQVTLDGLGRLGIGTTSPDANSQLHVVGSSYQPLYINTTGAGGGGAAFLRSGTQALYVGTAGSSWLSGSSTADGLIRSEANLIFGIGNSEKTRIDSSGRLLVGTSSSFGGSYGEARLQVSGSLNGDPAEISLRRNYAGLSANGMGSVVFYSPEGRVAQVTGNTDGTQTAGTSSPGSLSLLTTPSGSTTSLERMRLAQNGRLTVPYVYNDTAVTSANVFVDSNGVIGRATSSARYKTNIETMEDFYADAVLSIRPVWFKSLCENDNPEWGYWGFIAEEVAEIDPRLAHWKRTELVEKEDGRFDSVPLEQPIPDGVMYDRFVPHLLNLIKRQGEAITELQAEVAALKGA